ncbi:MAG: hypothetical protein EOM03_11240 [Clostridia bacterium]|nr:hypothetical protein [Clostridia bacterium]
MENAPVIVKTVTDLFTTYDVTDNGYVVNERGRKYTDIAAEVEKKLKEQYPEAWSLLDYFDLDSDLMHKDKGGTWPVRYWRTAVFYVKGSNEGYYFHVEIIDTDGKLNLIFLGKTLSGDRSDAEKIHNAIARVFEV